jgi:hypothetical protein
MDRAISTDHQDYGMWTPAFEQLHAAAIGGASREEVERLEAAEPRRYPPSHPSGVFQNYQATTERDGHPEEQELTGRVYRYQPSPVGEPITEART